ncbi:MAG TPA: methyltransferase domain-containing protein, partial [Anaerolineaceae bacterium]
MSQPQLDRPYFDYQRRRRSHWDAAARLLDRGKRSWGSYYHRRLAEIYRGAVQPGASVLEIGCGEGDLLAAVNPSYGLGIDFSREMLKRAKTKHPGLHFCLGDAHEGFLDGKKFDFIILSDLLNDAWDVQAVFANLAELCHPGTRIILNTYSRLWELPLLAAEKLQLARPVLYQNWLTVEDARILMRYGGFEIVRTWHEILSPLPIPLLTGLSNRYLARLAPLNQLCLSNFIIGRRYPVPQRKDNPSVSIIVPARNEAG